MRKFIFCTIAGLFLSSVVHAQESVVWWDFLSGGDGVRMKQLLSDFNAEYDGEISIDATTLEWGVPYYTKVQTSVAVGEAPDIMTYHASRIPLGVETGVLDEITSSDWSEMGLDKSSFASDIWNAVNIDGKTYGVPFDTHPIVLYYNKDILGAHDLLDSNGLPKGLDSHEGFVETLKKLKDSGSVQFPLGSTTADGNFIFRTIYSFMGQQGGELITNGEFLAGDNKEKLKNSLALLQDWTNKEYQSKNTDYQDTVGLFTSGQVAFMINGVWEVPTMIDLHKDGKLFEWGASELPLIFDRPANFSDSHIFAIPANNDMSKEKRSAVLKTIKWFSENSLFWATAGHIPAYQPVTQSKEYQEMQPNSTYSSATANLIYDPKTPLAGVAGPIYDVMSNYFVPTLLGELDPEEAVDEIELELNDL